MQSKMILAVCAMLFTMCVLWTMAVPKPRPREQRAATPAAAAAPAAPAAPRATQGEMQDGLWSPAGFGLRLRAPATWRPARTRGRARLACDPADALRGQFELSARAVVGDADLAARAEALRATLSTQLGFELLGESAAEISGREARRIDWRARSARGELVRSSALLWIGGPQEMQLVFSAADARWGELEAVGAAGLASLELGPPAIRRP